MKKILSIYLLSVCLFSCSAVHAQSTGKPTGFMGTTWGMKGSELTNNPKQLSKTRNKQGDVMYATDYCILVEKTFSAQFIMDDSGGLKAIQILRAAKAFEKDTYKDLFVFLKKQYDYIGSRNTEDGEAAYVIDTFATEDSNIKLITTMYPKHSGAVVIGVLYQPR